MSHDNDHAWAKDLLGAYLDGRLSAVDRDRVDAHLNACEECARSVQDLASETMTVEEADEQPRVTLLGTIRSYRPGPAARGLLAAAAVVLLGIIGFVIVETEPGGLLAGERLVSGPFEALAVGVPESPAIVVSSQRPKDIYERKGLPRDDVAMGVPLSEPAIFSPEARDHQEWANPDAFLSFIKGENLRRSEPRPGASDTMGVGGGGGGGGRYVIQRSGGHANMSVRGGNNSAFRPADQVETAPLKVVAPSDPLELSRQNQEEQARANRRIIRSGQLEFEIESFDAAVAILMKITLEEQGFIATVNSEKLQNGKVRGVVVVRVPPDRLDTLLLKLRALGDLRSQKVGSEDVTKVYTDLESRLRAARMMEERLINIIKEGKGQIKDLLAAEKELGEWRTRIETMIGEMKYYDNLLAHSTLTISLTEKEIRSPFAVVETERVDMGVEVDDVEKSHKETLAAVAEAKGRVIRSDLRQLTNDQFQSSIQFEVAPDQAGALRDRVKQMGVLSRLEITRVQENQGGSGKPSEAKVRQGDTQVTLSLTNASDILPRETLTITLSCMDAEKSYKAIVDRVEKASGRLASSQLMRQKNEQTSGVLVFQVRAADAEGVLADIRAAGEVMKLDSREAIGTANTTRAKRGFVVNVYGFGALQPRETSTVVLASPDVASGYAALLDAAKATGARILNAELNESDRKKVTASLSIDVRRDQEKTIAEAVARAGQLYTRNSTRAQDADQVVDSKTVLHFRLFDAANIPARETVKMSLQVGDVEAVSKAIESQFQERIVDARHTRQSSGERESVLTFDTPLKGMAAAVERIKGLGVLGEQVATKNAAVPDNELAVARFEVRVANQVLVSDTSGPWANIRKGLAFSLQAASWSLMLIMVGLCFVLPLGMMIWLAVRLRRKLRPKAAPAA